MSSKPATGTSATPAKDTYGTEFFPDLKSLGLNISSMALFALPFCIYFDRSHGWEYAGGVAACFAVALILPPMGWYRPHPYSDMESNRLATKQK